MERRILLPLRWAVVLFAVSALFPFERANAAESLNSGLRTTFTAGAASDTTVLPNLWLYVPAGQSPTPFVDARKFDAIWSGFVSVDLRSEYTFHAEFNGDLKLELNGAAILETNSTGAAAIASKPVRLSKGTNAFVATFRSPSSGDAFVRLEWAAKGTLPLPIPLASLSHMSDASLETSSQVRTGRELLIESRCVKCHSLPAGSTPLPDLAMDAPSFEGIGSRRNSAWMADWILDPKAERPNATMPRIFHGATEKQDAAATAAFLASLKSAEPIGTDKPAADGRKEAGQVLFESLHCVACHNAPESPETAANKVSLKQVRAKFAPGALAAFLKRPEEHFEWTRMPNFKLSDDEADQLSAFLLANADPLSGPAPPSDDATIERGRKLVLSSGCLNCHSLKLEDQFTTKPLGDLAAGNWTGGCVAASAGESKAPFFAFTSGERDALKAFAESDRSSLSRHVPAEFAERHSRTLNCRECHGKFEGFPGYDLLGWKLKPEWSGRFVAGEVSYKPRPWLRARMPAFPKWAQELARGMATQHGLPPQTPAEPPVIDELAGVGRKLVGSEGGFSCISCHAVGKVGATQVFESAGVNFAYTAERVQKPYYHRWVLNPLRIEPSTKMPVYFDELGQSPLADPFESSGPKQIEAMWQYIRLGDKMLPPPGAQAAQ